MIPALILSLAAAPLQAAQRDTATFPELGLSLELPALAGSSSHGSAGDQIRGRWSGRLGDTTVSIALRVLPAGDFHLREPEDMAEHLERNRRGGRGSDGFFFSRAELLEGPYG
ncbi:MAG TPA: hypothetical protein VMS76_06670, partial [Planctomycetota bacterium]|nr:hypothetical protein [Planctomycetota bacterium]